MDSRRTLTSLPSSTDGLAQSSEPSTRGEYCRFCGLIDDNLCQTQRRSDNCPHALGYISPEELAEIEELI